MGKKLKLALIAMLGFSTACSTSKKSAKSNEPGVEPQPSEVIESPRIMLMYGVRPPLQVETEPEIGEPQTEESQTEAKAEAKQETEPAAVQQTEQPSEVIEIPRTVVMYGVKPPYPVAVKDSVVKDKVLQNNAVETDPQAEE